MWLALHVCLIHQCCTLSESAMYMHRSSWELARVVEG
jgi:hypothetical protein